MKFGNQYPLIASLKTPDQVKTMSPDELGDLAGEIRNFIIDMVSHTGGHLASSLGVVELTIALHYVFNTPSDKLIWDVGHQVYSHKVLTGRARAMYRKLRKYKGISGFPKKSESIYDHYDTGHSGTSISFALGLAEAQHKDDDDHKVIAIIGDGSTSSGIAFEGLNNSGQLKNKNLIVILNDNEMSISPNVGALSQYISRQMTTPSSAMARRFIKRVFQSIPKAGQDLVRVAQKLERSLKELIQPGMFFEELGFLYLGPFDGHNLKGLIELFRNIKKIPGPLLIHVLTKKGYGYEVAEMEPERFHGASPFDIETGEFRKKDGPPSYTRVFGDTVVELARKDSRIIAITAAMTLGTGLTKFSEIFPERFYDVGIAEQHAVTFAGGLAAGGYKPIVAIYSTFLQRAYDQVFHDVCLQKLPVVFAVDRGGLVGADGPTHHGVFDLSYLRHLPEMVVIAPRDENELRRALFSAVTYDKPVAVRYPRGEGIGVEISKHQALVPLGKGERLRKGLDVSVIGVGPLIYDALAAAEDMAREGIEVEVIDARFVKPLDTALIIQSVKKTGRLLTLEENAVAGGFGSAVLELLADNHVALKACDRLGVPDRFVGMGSQLEIRKEIDLTKDEIILRLKKLLSSSAQESVSETEHEVVSSSHDAD